APSPDARRRCSNRRRNRRSEETASTEKSSHWSHAGPCSPSPARAPTTSAARPKNSTKKPPGVSTSIPRSPRPTSTHAHHVMRPGTVCRGTRANQGSQPRGGPSRASTHQLIDIKASTHYALRYAHHAHARRRRRHRAPAPATTARRGPQADG